ncbi:MAG TPA: ATP-binding protein [Thermoanaerobaculia bacterium]|nr:ATP-binding protein [Thermoanaerobaculia bacterium]
MITSVAVPYFLLRLTAAREGRIPFFGTGMPDLLLLLAGATYLASLGYIALLRPLARRAVLQAGIQFGGDMLLITGLVYWFGGIASPFSLLYLLVIATAAVMLRRRAAFWAATAAYAAYAALLLALFQGWLPEYQPTVLGEERIWRLTYNLAVHLFGFYAVALLTSHLAQSVSRSELALAEQRDSLADLRVAHRDVVQSIPSGLLTTDLEGAVTGANRAAEEILGRSERSLLGTHVAESGLFSRARWERETGSERRGSTARADTEVERQGTLLPIGYSLGEITDAHGRRSGYLVVFQDLSEWRRLQEEVRVKDRMAAVGELAAGLAHEVGNPLAAISGSVQMLSSDPGVDPSQRQLLAIVHRESQRLDRTIKGFLRFARPRDRAAVAFDIARLVAEHFELLRNSEETGSGHRLSLELDPPSVTALADPDQVSQIFWNLARNALRAMPDGGDLLVRGEGRGATYRLAFRDSGRGMSAEQRTRLFQPFQSFFDGGTGLGMAIVYRIAQEHAGRVQVESTAGSGSTITVELPLRPPETETEPGPEMAAAAREERA